MASEEESIKINQNKNNEKNKKFVSIEEYLELTGSMSRFQIIAISIFCMSLIVPSCQALVLAFIGDTPQWKCTSKSSTCNTTKVYNTQENCNIPRDAWVFVKPTSYSIVTQFDLVCDHDTLTHLSNSALFIGQLFGGLITGYFSDRFGRKNACFVALLCLDIVAFASSFSPNIWVFIVLRAIAGIFQCGAVVTIIVISVELVKAKYRALAGIIIWNFWTISVCFMSLYSWLVPEWRKLLMIITAPFIFVPIVGLIFVPESVRWYHSQNRVEEAERVLLRVAKINKRKVPENVHLEHLETKQVLRVSYLDLFKTTRMTLKTLTFCVMWYTNDLLYYAIILVASNFGGSLYRDFVLISLVEMPAAFFSIFAVDKFGRKPSVITGYIIVFGSMLTYGVLEVSKVNVPFAVRITLAMVAKFFAILSWSSTEVWAVESYPTVVRAQSMALFYVMNQLGSGSAPWLAQWIKKFEPSLPFFVIGGFAAISCLICLWMPDTKDVPIQNYLEDNIDEQVNCDSGNDLVITNGTETTHL